jgi:antitoxin component YwqK of YwqJK toxin-antitoxin module
MGKIREYYANNCVKAEGYIKDGKKEDLWTYYYENGNKFRMINYKMGIEDGMWVMWHENGNLYIEENKNRGKTNGLWKEYYENGKIKEIGEYVKGSYIPKDFWDEEGNQLLKNGNGKKIEKFGAGLIDVFEHYFENGKLVKEIRI